MEQTAQPAFLVPAQRQRGAAVDTEFIEHTDLAVGIAEHDQIFAEQLRAQRRAVRFGDLMGRTDRQPEPAHHAAHRCIPAGAGKSLVLFGADHGCVPGQFIVYIAEILTDRPLNGKLCNGHGNGICAPRPAVPIPDHAAQVLQFGSQNEDKPVQNFTFS